MNCPVCHNAEVPDGTESCASCGSDLSALNHIAQVQNQRKGLRTTRMVLGILLFVAIIVSLGMGLKKGKTRSAADQALIDSQTSELQQMLLSINEKDAEIASLKEEMELLKTNIQTDANAAQVSTTSHIIKRGDSLWKLAVSYFNDGFKFRKIADDNHIGNVNLIVVGDTLVINNQNLEP